MSAADMDGFLDYFKEASTRTLPELGCEARERVHDARNIGEILLSFALPSIRVQGSQVQRRNRD
jgi:hypothetical protein